LARGRYRRVVEIPYEFKPRHAGTSKMSFSEQWNYIRHLALLAATSKPPVGVEVRRWATAKRPEGGSEPSFPGVVFPDRTLNG